MKKGIFIIAFILIFIAGIVFYQFAVNSSGKKQGDGWSEGSTGIEGDNKTTSGKWGVELIAGYVDGSTDHLTDFSLEIKFREKEVSYFKYVLYTSAGGQGYNNVSLDLTGFDITAVLYDSGGNIKWSSDPFFGETVIAPLNGEWTSLYEISVSASGFNLLDGTYTLEFVPEGIISIRGIPDGNDYNANLPDGESLEFTVETDKWIDVIVSSGSGG